LLERAAEIGLLSRLTPSYYRVHPALPWFFRDLFQCFYPGRTADGTDTSLAMQATLAYALEMTWLADAVQSRRGKTSFVGMRLEEENLLHVARLARDHQWLDILVSVTDDLGNFYDNSGRTIERARLLRTIVAEFIDTKLMTALPGARPIGTSSWCSGFRSS
jgi:hypothetical protein